MAAVDEAGVQVLFKQPVPGLRSGSKLFMHLFSHYHAEGRANIPQPPFLLTSNHLSYFDAPAIGAAVNYVIPAFAAKKYRGTLMGMWFNIGSPVWIEQEAPDRQALTMAIKILEQGHLFAIAPEGHRSKTGALMRGHEGVAFIASRAGVPILPVAISGTERLFHALRPEVRVSIGKPYHLPAGRVKGEQLAAYTDRIMCALAALLPEAYRGVYAGHPLLAEMSALVA